MNFKKLRHQTIEEYNNKAKVLNDELYSVREKELNAKVGIDRDKSESSESYTARMTKWHLALPILPNPTL